MWVNQIKQYKGGVYLPAQNCMRFQVFHRVAGGAVALPFLRRLDKEREKPDRGFFLAVSV